MTQMDEAMQKHFAKRAAFWGSALGLPASHYVGEINGVPMFIETCENVAASEEEDQD